MLKWGCEPWDWLNYRFQVSARTRVLIGFSLIPKLSWERSSGAMIEWLEGLLAGLEPLLDEDAKCGCLWKPKPIKKHSIGIIMEFGCSSVTSEPQASTWSSKCRKLSNHVIYLWAIIWVFYVTTYLNKCTDFAVHFFTHVDRFSMEWTTLSCKYKCLALQVL
jgi:hypothetical protein